MAAAKVRRGDHGVLGRQYLGYLNVIERINCYYCGYFNGLIAYIQEIAARTEQYWCPIKHARGYLLAHSRAANFADFGAPWRIYCSPLQLISSQPGLFQIRNIFLFLNDFIMLD